MNKNKILGPRIDYQSDEFNIMQPNFSMQGKINERDIIENENFTGARITRRAKSKLSQKASIILKNVNSPKVEPSFLLQAPKNIEATKIMETSQTLFSPKKIKENPSILVKNLKKIQKVKLAVKKFLEKTNIKRIDNLKNIHFKIINDSSHIIDNVADFSKKNQQRSHFKSFFGYFSKKFLSLMGNFPLLKPHSTSQLVWEIWMFFVLVYFCFTFSVELSFDIDMIPIETICSATRILGVLFYFADIIVKMNTVFYKNGLCVSDRGKIIQHYKNSLLIYDLISISALFFSFSNIPELRQLKIFFFATFKNFRNFYKKIHDEWKTGDLFDLIILMARMIAIAHFIACMWHALGYYRLKSGDTSWLTEYINDIWIERYLLSFYWAITTLCTVGYGDFTPKSLLEVFFVSCIMLLGTLVYGYTLNSVGSLINRLDKRKKDLIEKINIIDEFMHKNGVNEALKLKVKKYIHYAWKRENKNFEKSEKILEKLPYKMREEILLESTGKFLKSFPILTNNFSPQLIDYLALNLKPLNFSPSDVIYKKGIIDQPSIFLISSGEIDLIHENNANNFSESEEIVLKTLKKGNFFGELAFFSNCPYEETARSCTFSTIYKISRSEFLSILAAFPQDYDKLCMIKDKIIYSNDYSHLKSTCFSCKNPQHRTLNCPYLSFGARINKDIIIQKKFFSQPQIRKNFNRKKRIFNAHALKDRKFLMKTAIISRFNKDLMGNFEDQQSINSSDNHYHDPYSDSNMKGKKLKIRKYSYELRKEGSESSLVCKKYKSLEDIIASPGICSSKEESYLNQRKITNEKILLNDGSLNELPSPQLRKPIIQNNNQKNKENLTLVDKRGKKQLFIETKAVKSYNIRSDVEEIENLDSAALCRLNSNISQIKEKNSALGITPALQKDVIQKKDLFMYNFDGIKEYETYFKERNASDIVKNLKTKKIGKMRKSYRLI